MPHDRTDGTRRGTLRRRLLVDARFQVTWVAGVIGIATVLLIVLGGLYLSSLSEQRRLVGVNRLCLDAGTGDVAPEDREFDAELVSRLEEEDTRSTLILALSAAALVVLLAALAVRLTFHVAGPAKAVSAMLRHMTEGDPEPIRRLRRGDQFGFLEADVRHLHERLGRQADADGELLEEAAALLDERPGAGRHLADRLRERATALRKRFPPLRD